ncbi:MAG: ABC transporter ATP-binding protein [Clostridiales bacterium]|nr:ABC transporter ATP-binding protein [Clostridiales bacterium]MDY2834289.1 ABC transporter ATP-binding protein [Candidatus Aphodomonas sp.]
MDVLEVKGLCKTYPAFTLDHVSFHVGRGRICGFIGRNGAGKSTTLGSLTGLVHPDAGEARFFGMDLRGSETAVKRKTGFVSSGVNYYPNRKLRTITSVTRAFYPDWDEAAYERYMKLFHLDEAKTPAQLSAGMKVKYALALALSHRAELLILDEPTSGLDPVSRDELLDIFMQLSSEGKSILFSTHITSDLDKCADDIVYIQRGRILAEETLDDFVAAYRLVEFDAAALTPAQREALVGEKRVKHGFSALTRAENAALFPNAREATLEEIMVHLEKEETSC